MQAGARVHGVRELNRNLRAMGASTSELAEPGRRMAERYVVPGAQAQAARLGRGYARAASTLRPASSQRGGAVRLGNARVPDALGWEFGAAHNRRRPRRGPGRSRSYRGYNQFPAHRGQDGHFLWPTIRRDLPRLQADHLKELAKLARRYGFDAT